MLKFLTRGFWTPKPKSPEDVLSNLLKVLDSTDDEHPDDFAREKYMRKHMASIQTAMMTVNPEEPSLYNSEKIDQLSDDQIQILDAKITYLDWCYNILTDLYYKDHEINTSQDSPSANYFLAAIESDVREAFETIFAADPALAIGNLRPALLFQNEIWEKMKLLSQGDDAKLYFECLEAVDICGDHADKTPFFNTLSNATFDVLNKMVEEDPIAVFFFSYLEHLPEGRAKKNFINEHINLLETAVHLIIPHITDQQGKAFDGIFNSFTDEERPARLVELKNLMNAAQTQTQRIKKCFRLAADPSCAELADTVISLEGQGSSYIRTYTEYDHFEVTEDGILQANHANPFIPKYEFVRLENPAAESQAHDQDLGPDSKYLWMIKKANQILVAAFTKADVTKYLEAKTDIVVGEFPTAKEWQHTFCREMTAPEMTSPSLPSLSR